MAEALELHPQLARSERFREQARENEIVVAVRIDNLEFPPLGRSLRHLGQASVELLAAE
ncbi:hypothetical protein GXP70_16180 [Paenibacillus lycopersici]|uniref:Uncharacterized protein n=1 Tax=Paenibacillus lycopersici TaxID=2704462 RepID=A0A6C0G108_9BACL|nr:hypothetical protein [Paenibacillus lycopersici]QHT61341.1 hypothetical protein GXP70_16180 [Paenibacillus lycopersici]